MEEPLEFPQRREIPEIIGTSLKFIKSEFKPLAKYTLIYALPFIIVLAALQLFISSKLASSLETIKEMKPEMMLQELMGIYKYYFLILLFNIFVQSLFMAIIYTYVHAYLDRGRNNFTSSEITSAFFTNAYISLGTCLVVTVIAVLGLFLCIIPGILLANSLSLAVFIAVYERKGIVYSIRRSWDLVKLQWWGTFALNLFGILIMQITSMVLSAPASIGNDSTVLIETGESFAQMASDWKVWVSLGASVVSSLLSVISFVFLALQYFNLKEREKEFPGIHPNPPLV